MDANAREQHWQDAWSAPATTKSWYQDRPDTSLQLLEQHAPGSVVDIGGGASTLVDVLLEAGRSDITVVDIAASSLAAARDRLGPRADQVTWVVADILTWTPGRTYDAWHDRAMFHFLVDPADRAQYRTVMAEAVPAGGHAVMATFADDGPDRCSGLDTTRWSERALSDELDDWFEALAFEREIHRTPAGDGQAFLYGVFRRRAD